MIPGRSSHEVVKVNENATAKDGKGQWEKNKSFFAGKNFIAGKNQGDDSEEYERYGVDSSGQESKNCKREQAVLDKRNCCEKK